MVIPTFRHSVTSHPSGRTVEGATAAARFPGLAVALLFATACAGEAGGGPGQQGAGAAPVEVVVARTDTVVVEVRSVGSLEADARIMVKAESEGRVVGVDVREGSRVRDDQVLLRLDPTKLQAEVEVAEAAAARNEAERDNLARQLERNRELLAQGAISPQTFDDIEAAARAAEARLREARASLELARRRLDDATVRAPFGGEVGARSVNVGDYLEVGAELFELVDNDPLEIDFPVPERYLGSISLGADVEVRVRNFADRAFRGTVVFISPLVDPVNRTVGVKASVANPAGELRSGQFADVRLELDRRPDAVVIPEEAVVPGRADDAVFVVSGDSVVRRSVRLGTRTGSMVEVLEGVAAGETVVIAGQQRLSDGAPVRVTGTD